MKAQIHPDYQEVVFMDSSVDPPYRVLTRSTRTSEETIKMDNGKTYPLIRLEISSASHPFYTGKMKLVDTAGMIDRYRQRYGLKDKESASKSVPPETVDTPVAAKPAGAPDTVVTETVSSDS